MMEIVSIISLKTSRTGNSDRRGRCETKSKYSGLTSEAEKWLRRPEIYRNPRKQKNSRRLVFLNSGAGLGNVQLSIELFLIIVLFSVFCQDPQFAPYFTNRTTTFIDCVAGH